MAKVCRGKKKKLEKPPERRGRRRPEEKQKANFLAQDENDVYTMYHMSSKNKKSYTVDIKLCGRTITMEIDTGTSKTVLNEATYDGLRDALGPLRKTEAVLSTYTGQAIPVAGEITVPVTYGSQQENLKALVVKGKGPNLLGRDWLGVIRLDWNKILQITSDKR